MNSGNEKPRSIEYEPNGFLKHVLVEMERQA